MNVLLSVLLIFTLACVFPKGSMISMVACNPLLPGAPQKLVLVNSVELAWFISSRAIQQSQSPSKAFSMMPFMAKMQSVVLCPLECHRNLHVHSRLWLKPHLLGHNKTWPDCLCESLSYKVALAERILRSCMNTHLYHCSLGSSSFFSIIPTPWYDLLPEPLYSSVCFLPKFTLTAPYVRFLNTEGGHVIAQ